MKKITAAQARQTFRQVQVAFDCDDPNYGPALIMDFDWFGHGPAPAIVWEGGPEEWTRVFCDQQYEHRTVNAKVFIEPQTAWALGMYRDDN